MNEKLTVRDFGPIRHAEVEFKRVTVFIGPTGGGKSTLAKLAAVLRDNSLLFSTEGEEQQKIFDKLVENYELGVFFRNNTMGDWKKEGQVKIGLNARSIKVDADRLIAFKFDDPTVMREGDLPLDGSSMEAVFQLFSKFFGGNRDEANKFFQRAVSQMNYVPADRAFASSVHDALAGLQVNNVALPRPLLKFMSQFEVARKELRELPLPFFGVTYRYEDGQNLIVLPDGTTIRLTEAASGLQTIVPLLVIVEYQRRLLAANKRSMHGFVIEEPELNLFPTAQRYIIETLISQCTQAGDELIINTHSPYVLSHLNLLLYAWQVAQQHPERVADIAAIAPQEAWINPAEFAVYYVADGTVRSIFDAELGLIDHNELDAIGARSADQFDQLVDISNGL